MPQSRTGGRSGPSLAEVGEAGLLARIARALAGPVPGVRVPMGDDAAVLQPFVQSAVLTTDLLIEKIDFDFAWAAPADVGAKAAAVNLSDLAAMGAAPRALLLSLGLPADLGVSEVMALIRSLHRFGKAHRAPLVGGDLSRTVGPLVVSVTAVGEVQPERALLRRRGREGDVILVSGALGGAAAALELLLAGKRPPPRLLRRQLRPQPRLALGRALARWGHVASCADISDGLAADVLHVVSPGCTAMLDVDELPIEPGVTAVARRLGKPAWELALTGGEDFELVLAVPPARVAAALRLGRRCCVPLTPIGNVVRGSRLELFGASGASLTGFDHFKRTAAEQGAKMTV